jgi:hypothetical protein
VLALLAYAGALGAPFIYDDFHGIVDNPSIRDLHNLKWIFIGSRRFVTAYSYAVDYALWGPRPFGFHLTNLLLHVATSVALYGLARRLWQNDAPALFAAALFAVHPLGSETVAYASSRAGLLCALFLVLGVWAWHRGLTATGSGRRWLLAVLPLWVLATLSKETGLLLPVLCVACDVLLVEGWRRRLIWYLPGALVAAAAGAWRVHSYLHLEHGLSSHLGLRLLTQAEVFWRYVFLWMAPVGLSLVHAAPAHSGPSAWLAVLSLMVAVPLLWRLPRPAIFGGVWLLLLLLPTALVPLLQPMAEHRVYEAMVGAALVSAAVLRGLPRPKLIGAVMVALLLVVTLWRVQLWRHPARLWRDAAQKAPGECVALYALGDSLRDQSDCSRAIAAYQQAMACNPKDRRAPRARAICLAVLGRYDEADAQLRALLLETPQDATLYYNLGLLEISRGRPEAARAYLLRALALAPNENRPCEPLRRLSGELPTVCESQIR